MSDLHPPTTHAVPLELPPGATLQGGRYVVERTLGRGGFGITYAAHDGRLERAVALKELFIDGVVRHDGVVVPPPHAAGAFAAAKQRFLREASVLARFTHPGIVRVYEVFEEAGTAYLVMELLEGHTLHEHVVTRGRPLDEPHALAIAQQCAAALAVVHRAGILHRDLNPSNVMLTDDGRVVLIDFGLAREFTADQTTPMTRMVTPGYAPPEQYAANARCGTPTDVYGLAATLYWALTARAPAPAIDRQTGAPLVPPNRAVPTVSKLVSDAVLDGLELNAAHRPATVDAFVARLGLERGAPPVAARPVAIPGRDVTRAEGTRALPPPPAALPVPPAVEPGRRLALAPLLVLAAALGALVPVVALAAVAVLVLPALATAGDAIVFVRLRRAGDEARLRWRHRAALGPYLSLRLLRNAGQVCIAAIPAMVLAAAAVALSVAVDSIASAHTAADWILRAGGAASVALAVRPVVRDRVRFKLGVVLDRVVAAGVRAGSLTPAGQGLWVVAAVFVLGAIGLRPDPWPI